MDEELLDLMIQEAFAARAPEPEVDPRAAAEAIFLSRLAQQDVTDPSRFTRREGPSTISRLTELTPFGSLGRLVRGFEERDPVMGGQGALELLLSAGGLALLSRLGRGGRTAANIERRTGGDRRAVPREGPGGRRASDPGADQIMADAERLVAQDLFGQARRAADAPAATTVDPLAELLRILGGGPN